MGMGFGYPLSRISDPHGLKAPGDSDLSLLIVDCTKG
jgi:hypothetical protein